MITSRDEFLLLLTKWKNSSATVSAFLVLGGKTTENPLSSALILELPASITGFDGEVSFLVLGNGETGLLSVGFEGAEFHFETAADLDPSFSAFLPESVEVDEMITLVLPTGLKLSLATLKRLG
jgi:hypothetical protein